MKSKRNISEFRTILVIVLILVVVSAAGVFLYKKLSQTSRKISESIKTEVPASFVAKQILLELRTAENNARSYYLTQDMSYIVSFYESAPRIENQISLLNNYAFKNKSEKSIIDSVIKLSRQRFNLIKQQSYFNDPSVVTQQLSAISEKIDETYATGNNHVTTNIDSIKKKEGFFKRIFQKKTPKKETKLSEADQDSLKKTETNISKKQLKAVVKKVETSQLEQLEEFKQLEYAYAQRDHIMSEKINLYTDELKLREDLKTQEITSDAKKQVNDIKFFSIIFSLVITCLLFTLIYLITSYIKKKNQVEATLTQSKQHADELAKAKETFLANMSHEIKTPLNAIYGFTEQILAGDLESEQREQLKIVKNSAAYLTKLVNNILTYSKLQAGKDKLDISIFNLKEEFQEIEALFKNQAKTKGIDFLVDTSKFSAAFVLGDLNKLKQILFNLIGNALKFTTKGKVTIHLSQKILNHVYWMDFRIKDTGKGIAKDDLPRLFNEFEQVGKNVQKEFGGTGLGLVITKQIVERLGGKIVIKSELNSGTEVKVSIPFVIAEAPSDTSVEQISATDQFSFENKTILIVDDDEFNRLLIKSVLKKYKLLFLEAKNGNEAIQLVESKKIDAVLMDLRMPQKNGIETTIDIRKFNKTLPIIGATAEANEEKIAQCIAAGMNSVILKPFTGSQLIEALTGVFEKGSVVNSPNLEQISDSEFGTDTINAASLNQYSAEDDSFKIEMIRLFYTSINNALVQIEDAASKKDFKTVGELAHKIIPSCKHFEATKLIGTLKQLELLIDEQLIDETKTLQQITSMKEQIKHINAQLQSYL